MHLYTLKGNLKISQLSWSTALTTGCNSNSCVTATTVKVSDRAQVPWTQGKYNFSSSEDITKWTIGCLMWHQVVYGIAAIPINWATAWQLNVCSLQSLQQKWWCRNTDCTLPANKWKFYEIIIMRPLCGPVNWLLLMRSVAFRIYIIIITDHQHNQHPMIYLDRHRREAEV